MNKTISNYCSLALCIVCTFVASVSAQTNPVVLFQDSFENSVVGSPPAATNPVVGKYLLSFVNTSSTNAVTVLSGAVAGGPSGAADGNNYVRIKYTNSTVSPILGCDFAVPFVASNTPFNISCDVWQNIAASDGAQLTIGSGIVTGPSQSLLYSYFFAGTTNWEWYNGSAYTASGEGFVPSAWNLVDISWDGTNFTGSINNGPYVSLGQWGSPAMILSQFMFRGAATNTIFYVDDINITTTAPIITTAVAEPAPNLTAVPPLPLIQFQFANGTQTLQTNTIQLMINGSPVTPTCTQTVAAGFTNTVISYQTTNAFASGSQNTATCTFSDTATNAYSNSTTFTTAAYAPLVQTGTTVFYDSFETANVGQPPITNGPVVGSYTVNLTANNGSMTILSGPVANGPPGAIDGNNYVQLDRADTAVGPILESLFPFSFIASNTPFNMSCYMWMSLTPNNAGGQLCIGNGTATSSAASLIYTYFSANTSFEWYNGSSYTATGADFIGGQWNLVDINWDGTNMTGSINGSPYVSVGIWGNSSLSLNQAIFRTGVATAILYVDDVKVTVPGTLLKFAALPAPGATAVSQKPTISLQVYNGSQAVQTNTIQMSVNGAPVTFTSKQTNTLGIGGTFISYQPPANLPYGSSNYVTWTFTDNATPPNSYTNTTYFTVVTYVPPIPTGVTTLFADGLERSVVGGPPAPTDPQAGTYGITLGGIAPTVVVLTGSDTSGPSGAAVGSNYMKIDRADSGNTPIVQCLLTTPFLASATPFNISCYIWQNVAASDGAQICIGDGIATSPTNAILYSSVYPNTTEWDWYNGSFYTYANQDIVPSQWNLFDVSWDGTNMTGSINGNPYTSLGTWGSSGMYINQVILRTVGAGTIFYADDIVMTTSAPFLITSSAYPQPTPGAVGVARRPLIEFQVVNCAQNLQPATMQMSLNGASVTPAYTAQTNSAGFTVTTISCPLTTNLPYGSSNTVTLTYADGATPANHYTNVTYFTVETGDTIFADNFEADATGSPPNAPQVGTWDPSTTVLVDTTGVGGVTQTANSGTNFMALYQGAAKADFATAVSTGATVQAQAWFNYQAGQVGWGFNSTGTNQFGELTLSTDGNVYLFNGTNSVQTGLYLTTGEWDQYGLVYSLGSGTITVSVNGQTATLPIAPCSQVTGLNFFENDALSSHAFVDDVLASADLGDLAATNPKMAINSLRSISNGVPVYSISISWPSAPGYELQQNPSLANPNGWVPVADGGTSPVDVPVSGTMFYRLAKPD